MKNNPPVSKPLPTAHLQLSYCYGGIVSYEPSETLGPRLLKDFEVVLIMEGNPIYQAGETRYELKPGSLLVARPNTVETYFWDREKRTRHAYLHFDLDKIPTDWPPLKDWPAAMISPPEVLRQLGLHLIDRSILRTNWPAEKPGPRQNRLMETFLDQYLFPDEDSPTQPSLNLSEPVSKAVKFMRERLDSSPFMPYDLEELSQHSHTSTKHLCRIFTSELGIPPIKASRLMQLQMAIPLLARTNLSMKEISERCGFTDQLYFSRYFSKTFGSPPSTIREELRAGTAPPHNPLPPSLMPRLCW